MQILPANDASAVPQALQALRAQGVVLMPTDTLYALAADATSDVAVDTVYAIKGRDEKKPMHALVDSLDMAARYGDVDDAVRALIERAPAGKVTFVIPKKPSFTTGIGRAIETFGFRIPDDQLCRDIIRAAGGPLTATSANMSGSAPSLSFGATLAGLGTAGHLVACALHGGDLPPSEPSTVIDMTGKQPRILRVGAVDPTTLGLPAQL